MLCFKFFLLVLTILNCPQLEDGDRKKEEQTEEFIEEVQLQACLSEEARLFKEREDNEELVCLL